MRKTKPYTLFVIIICAVVLTACNSQDQMPATMTAVPTDTPEPTETPTPTMPPTPTSTNTPEPTDTPKPTATPTMLPLKLGETQTVDESGFSFQPVMGFSVDVQADQAAMVSEDDEIILFMAVNQSSDTSSLAEVLSDFVQAVGELQASEPYPFVIGGIEGLAVDVNGEFRGSGITGRAAVVPPDDTRLFLAYGFAVGGRWKNEGVKVYDEVIDSITFFEPGSAPGAAPTEVASFPLPLPSGTPDSEWNGMPIMPQAVAGEGDDESYSFTVEATVDQVQSYYEQEMTRLGWTPLAVGTGENDSLLVIFQKGEETATVSIFLLEDNLTYVFLVR